MLKKKTKNMKVKWETEFDVCIWDEAAQILRITEHHGQLKFLGNLIKKIIANNAI